MRVVWDQVGQRFYESGVSKCVLYVGANGAYPKGVAWSGISSINESPSGAEASAIYADNIKYLNLISAEDYSSTIEAYTYPNEFMECNGYKEIAAGVTIRQQTRKPFGLSYVTNIGNDTEGNDFGYKIHLVYGAVAAPSEVSHASLNESTEPGTMSWEISTTAVEIPGAKPSATIEIDSTKISAEDLKTLEDILYGTEDTEARLPLPEELMTLLSATTDEVVG